MQEIPLIPVPNQELLVTLDNQNCTIAVYQRDESVYLDLTEGQQAVRRGAICEPAAPIISTPSPYFSGQLYMWDSLSPDNAQTKASYDLLGTRYKLIYVAESEMTDE